MRQGAESRSEEQPEKGDGSGTLGVGQYGANLWQTCQKYWLILLQTNVYLQYTTISSSVWIG